MQHSGDSSQFSPKKKELFSNTILQEAIKKKEPVCVENIIGHPWADAASVIEARIFSVACLPLSVGERVFGAIFLFTRSPGKSIRKEVLTELNLFATQAALMMASQAELRETRHENAKLRSLVPQVPTGLVFDSSSTNPMAEVARKISKLAPTPLNVLILGETGTGKEVVAREIHQQSTRAKKPFIAVNCAAIPGALLEATLFGHERGAFTGAVKAHEGKFLAAHGGTLLLDEIGDLPLELQSKLLRVLQEKLVEPLGSSRPIPVDVRILAATHQNLEEAVRAGRFRQDLFFRLNGSILKLPPLRERKEDLLVLAEHFLKQTGRDVQFSTEAFSALKKHSWPGNVRELEQVVQRAGLLCEGSEITAQDLELSEKFGSSLDSEAAEAELFSNLEKAQWGFTQEYVQRALAKYKGSRSEVAERLGISERTLYRILATQASGASGTSGKSV